MSGGFLIFVSSHLISVSHFPCFRHPPKITTAYSIKRWKMPKQHPTALVPPSYWATSAVFNLNPGAHCHPVVTCCNQVCFFFKQHAFPDNQHYKTANKYCFHFSFPLYIVSSKIWCSTHEELVQFKVLFWHMSHCFPAGMPIHPSVCLSVFLPVCVWSITLAVIFSLGRQPAFLCADVSAPLSALWMAAV